MARDDGPRTGAERQRAYRQRKKREPNAIVIPLHPGDGEPPEDPPGDEGEISLAELNARMRRMAMSAFDAVGGTEYLKRVASKNANTFLRFVGQFVTKEDTLNPGAFNVYVQQVVIEGATPVRGVISSPIAGHIDTAARVLAAPAITIDAEPPDA